MKSEWKRSPVFAPREAFLVAVTNVRQSRPKNPERAAQGDRFSRAFWLRHLHRWHWISAALSLVGMLLFAITGVTLNHASQIESRPNVVSQEATLPVDLRAVLMREHVTGKRPLPPLVADWLSSKLGTRVAGREAEWSEREVYLGLPRPGGDAWVSISLGDGAILHEVTDRGWISYLNDLHKGRHAGMAWSLFIDVFAGACVVFCATGLFLLHLHGRTRPATWPTVGIGLAIPVLLALLFIHS